MDEVDEDFLPGSERYTINDADIVSEMATSIMKRKLEAVSAVDPDISSEDWMAAATEREGGSKLSVEDITTIWTFLEHGIWTKPESALSKKARYQDPIGLDKLPLARMAYLPVKPPREYRDIRLSRIVGTKSYTPHLTGSQKKKAADASKTFIPKAVSSSAQVQPPFPPRPAGPSPAAAPAAPSAVPRAAAPLVALPSVAALPTVSPLPVKPAIPVAAAAALPPVPVTPTPAPAPAPAAEQPTPAS